jgi:exopolyphosphatase
VLKYAGLSTSDLLTLEDLGIPDKVNKSKWWKASASPTRSGAEKDKDKDASRWILVDHNRLTGRLGEIYGGNVVGCVDHHDDENVVPPASECEKAGQPRVIQPSGSCSSLVVGVCRSAWDELAASQDDAESRHWNHELARLALAPVLIDTHNLHDEIKTTDADREAFTYLEGWMKGAGKGFDATAYFDEISTAKSDIGGLCLEDILRKDFKMWVEPHKHGDFKLGISSVVKSIPWLVEKAGGQKEFAEAVEKFRHARGLDLQAVMASHTSKKGNFKRELFVLGKGKRGVKVAERFEGEHGKDLKLKLRDMMGDEEGEEGNGEGEEGGLKRDKHFCF